MALAAASRALSGWAASKEPFPPFFSSQSSVLLLLLLSNPGPIATGRDSSREAALGSSLPREVVSLEAAIRVVSLPASTRPGISSALNDQAVVGRVSLSEVPSLLLISGLY